jgi:hypothetical protein
MTHPKPSSCLVAALVACGIVAVSADPGAPTRDLRQHRRAIARVRDLRIRPPAQDQPPAADPFAVLDPSAITAAHLLDARLLVPWTERIRSGAIPECVPMPSDAPRRVLAELTYHCSVADAAIAAAAAAGYQAILLTWDSSVAPPNSLPAAAAAVRRAGLAVWFAVAPRDGAPYYCELGQYRTLLATLAPDAVVLRWRGASAHIIRDRAAADYATVLALEARDLLPTVPIGVEIAFRARSRTVLGTVPAWASFGVLAGAGVPQIVPTGVLALARAALEQPGTPCYAILLGLPPNYLARGLAGAWPPATVRRHKLATERQYLALGSGTITLAGDGSGSVAGPDRIQNALSWLTAQAEGKGDEK